MKTRFDTADSTSTPPVPIPVNVLTGFLGAGKTTLLNRLLADPALANALVVINEFGEVGLDHLLVERIDEELVLLSSGCLCCMVRSDLVEALLRFARQRELGEVRAFDRVVIETTGLADPAPVLHTLMNDPALAQAYGLDAVVTVVDAVNGDVTLDAHAEALKQAAVADRIVLTKTDLLDTPERRLGAERLRERLLQLNPGARIVDAATIEATCEKLFDSGLFSPEGKIPDVARWLSEEAYAGHGHHGQAHRDHSPGSHDDDHHEHQHYDVNRHDDRVRAFCLDTDRAVSFATLEMFFTLLTGLHGPRLLRVKGVIRVAEEPERPLVIHGVQHVIHAPVRLERWPQGDSRRSRLVFITRDLDERVVEGLFAAFMGEPQVDRPDREALVNNPLAIPGAAA